jgi:hypothetical protein
MMFFASLTNFIFAAAPCAKPKFFFLVPWYQYLDLSQDSIGKCTPNFHFPGDIWLVGLAIIQMLLSLAGFVAVISIIIAGFEYLTTQGNAEKGVAARKRIINALVGLAIVLIATGLVSFIGNTLLKSSGG